MVILDPAKFLFLGSAGDSPSAMEARANLWYFLVGAVTANLILFSVEGRARGKWYLGGYLSYRVNGAQLYNLSVPLNLPQIVRFPVFSESAEIWFHPVPWLWGFDAYISGYSELIYESVKAEVLSAEFLIESGGGIPPSYEVPPSPFGGF